MPFKAATKYTFPLRLIVSIEGHPDCGKTHFLFGTPRPLYIFNLDNGLEGMMTADKFDLARVYVSDYALDKPASLSKGDSVDRAIEVANRFKDEFRDKLEKKKRITLALDTASEFWQLFRLADLGKLEQVMPLQYVKVNRIWRGLMNEVFQTPHNLILLHRVKDVYATEMKDGKEVSTKVPGATERDGFKETEYIVQVSLKMWRKTLKVNNEVVKPLFGFTILKCRQRASLIGTEFRGDQATFSMLAQTVFPDSTEEDWQ